MLARHHPDQILDTAINALTAGPAGTALLDELPAPLYTTATEGRATCSNKACVAFAGRQPVVGQDRWCATWQPCTRSGAPSAPGACPTAPSPRERHRVPDA